MCFRSCPPPVEGQLRAGVRREREGEGGEAGRRPAGARARARGVHGRGNTLWKRFVAAVEAFEPVRTGTRQARLRHLRSRAKAVEEADRLYGDDDDGRDDDDAEQGPATDQVPAGLPSRAVDNDEDNKLTQARYMLMNARTQALANGEHALADAQLNEARVEAERLRIEEADRADEDDDGDEEEDE